MPETRADYRRTMKLSRSMANGRKMATYVIVLNRSWFTQPLSFWKISVLQ